MTPTCVEDIAAALPNSVYLLKGDPVKVVSIDGDEVTVDVYDNEFREGDPISHMTLNHKFLILKATRRVRRT